MSYRVINVLLSPGKDIERVSSFAANLAGAFGARLCAQYLMSHLENCPARVSHLT